MMSPMGRGWSHEEDPIYRRLDGEDSALSGSVTRNRRRQEARRQRRDDLCLAQAVFPS